MGTVGNIEACLEHPGGNVLVSRLREERVQLVHEEDGVTENWEVNLIICDIINHTEAGPAQAVRAVRKRLDQCAGNSNKSTILTLTVLETAAKNCR